MTPLGTVYSDAGKTNDPAKILNESNLDGPLKSAVDYVKKVKVDNLGLSPSQLKAQQDEKAISYFNAVSGGVGGADALSG